MKIALILALLLLVSCDERPAAPTAAQNEQLNDTEKMLDEMANSQGNAN